MVSKYSAGIPILQPISTVDTSPLYTAISKKQEQYDRGFLTVQSNLDSLAKTTDLVRKQDMDMFRQKMESKVEGLNSLGNVDLSDVKLTASLASDVSSIANDKEVKDAVSSTIQYRKWMKSWDNIQNNPKFAQYNSTINYQYDLENKVMPWLNNQVKSFTDSAPTYFFDQNAELMKALKEIKGSSIPTTDGKYIVNGKKVTPEQLQQIAYDKILTDNRFQKQMEVNAWYDVKSKTPQQIAERALSLKDAAIEDYSNRMSSAKNKMLLDQAENKDVTESKNFLEQGEKALLQLKQEKEGLLSGNFDAKQLALQNQRDGLLDFAGRQAWSDQKLTADPYGVLAEREGRTDARFQATMNYNAQKDALNFQLKQRELDIKALTATGKLTPNQVQNGVGMLEAYGGTYTAPSSGVLSDPNADYIDNYHKEIASNLKRGDEFMKDTVVKILADSGYYVAAGKVKQANSIGEITGIVGKDVKSDAKGVEIRKLYNQVRQKYIDIKDGRDDGAYFISNPDAAKTMNQAQKEFTMAADLSNLYRKTEDAILQERKISRADLEKAKTQTFSKAQYEKEKRDMDLYSTANEAGVVFPPYNEWVKRKVKTEVDKLTPLAELNKRLAETETSKKLFYNITPNKDLMKTKEGDYSWGALTNGILGTALKEGVKLTGKEGTFPLWGQQLGKLAEKNEDDLKDVEIDNVIDVSSRGLATVKFKKGNGDNAETIIGTVQLNDAQTALWMGNKNTDTRFSDMIRRNKTSGALNTMYKGIVVPYEIGYNPTLDAFQITVRRGNNPRAVKQSGEPYTSKRAEELEVAMEEQMKLIYERIIADGIPKEKWVDYAADVLTNTIKSDPKAYK
jgi:hypothetical protein